MAEVRSSLAERDTEAAARFAAAEAQWREQSTRALAEAAARAEAAESALAAARAEAEAARASAEIELRRRHDELAAVRSSLAERDPALAHARSANERARERWTEEAGANLRTAQETWAAEEAARLAAAEAQWREQSAQVLAAAMGPLDHADTALAEARAQAEAARATAELELRRLRDELAAVRASLADRDTGLAHALSANERARERWTEEAGANLRTARKPGLTEEAARFAAAEAQWREQSAQALAAATAPFEHADSALAAARAEAETARAAAEMELRRLRDELAAVPTSLVERDTGLAQALAAATAPFSMRSRP